MPKVNIGCASFTILSIVWVVLADVGALGAQPRAASLSEIQVLFNLATFRPQRFRIVADVSSTEQRWSPEQIDEELRRQNELFKDLAKLPAAAQLDRSNAIARSHSGNRIRHVEEWYSGSKYRLDQTDEGMFSKEYVDSNPGVFRNSFINVDDSTVSPYRSAFVDRQLRDAQLSKTKRYSKGELWLVFGLDPEVAFPLLVALADAKSLPLGRAGEDTDFSLARINSSKAEELHNGTGINWRLEAFDLPGQGNHVRFVLRGKTMSLIAPKGLADMEHSYTIARVGGRTLCIESSFTNLTAHESFTSKKGGLDKEGIPHLWQRTTIIPDSPTKYVNVTIKEADLNPSFEDKDVFSLTFPTNYIVSDVTSGQAVILQKPVTAAVTVQSLQQAPTDGRRIVIVAVLISLSFGLAIALFNWRRRKTIA